MISISSLDHLVLTVKDIDITVRFYCKTLGMQRVNYGENRTALSFGKQKINLHPAGNEFEPKAKFATPGSADLCLLTDTPIHEVIEDLSRQAISIEQGPIERTGAMGTILSVYIRDPDGNLIEIANQL